MADEETDSPYGLNKSDADFLKSFHLVLKELRGLVISNVEFYQRGNSSIHARYYATSCILFEHLQTLESYVIDIVPRLQEYDFSPQVPGNGYRSFITIVYRCILCVMQLCRHISVNKNNLLFRSSYYLKELEAYVETVGQLIACLGYLKQLISLSKDGELFYDEENPEADEILMEVEMLNTDCFYGRCLGFQFCESIQKLLQGIMVAMATFSECYEESSQVIVLASSLLNSSKYIVDQELRARQVVNVTRTADIKFCKAFWSIPESPVLHNLRAFTYPQVEVSELISLEPQNFELPHTENINETVTITPPCAHTGPAAVSVRLISHVVREGMQVKRKKQAGKKGTAGANTEPKSKGLLFHCHGGGFVAQSSQSHENYLRVWARKLKMPILSVDYSLAPEQPFPRALEESFYAYAWALKNPELLGWTGEAVCFAGDSAGGNLAISTALRAVSYGIRIPDGIMVAYSAMLVQYTPSPSRLMAMIDPLLPVGILTRCLAAYAGIADKLSSALAKPIFCNPGKYESWEVVDSDDVMKDSVGAEITKKLQTESKTDSDKGALPDRKLLGVPSTGWYLSREISGSCQSIENLDNEFVVCETEDLLEDSVHYKGKVTVIDEEFGRSETRHMDEFGRDNDDNFDDAEMKPEISEKTGGAAMDMAIIGDTKRTELHETDTVSSQQGSHSVQYQIPSLSVHPEVSSQKDISQIKSVENQNQTVIFDIGNDDIHEQDNTQPETLEEALKQLDSHVTITVDDVAIGSQTDNEGKNTKDGYAVCKDIIHEQDRRFMTVEGRFDMDRLSCHSIEDLTEISGKEESRSDCTPNNLDEKVDFGENCSDMKDEASSGSLTRQAQSNSDLDVKNAVRFMDSQDEDSFISELTRNKYAPPATDRFQRRSMSLNFPLSYPEGNSSSILPSPVFRTPLSPQLPPGSRPFTPKRFSVQRKITQSPIKLFRELPIVKNFYMSPILAPDDLLQRLPDIYMIACHFDPLLDDSIMFAKKLSKLGKNVDLSIVDHLPHGFLSLSDTSIEAKKAAGLCLEKIMKVLDDGAT